jgi:hypothetical protein
MSFITMQLNAQTDSKVVYETKLENAKVPFSILEQVKKDFPDYTIQETLLVPAKLYEQKWIIVQKSEPIAATDYYEVYLTGKNIHSTAAYTPKGILLHSREVLKEVALPAAVTNTIEARFTDWKQVRDKEVIRNGKREITHYIVFLKNGWREQRVVLNASGDVLHRFEY